MLAEAITFLFFSSVGKSLSIRETSHRPWGFLSLSVICFKVLIYHNELVYIVNTVKIKQRKSYQYWILYILQFPSSTFKLKMKCVHSKDTLTGDSSAVGQCGAAAGLLRLASTLRDPVLWLVSGWVNLYFQNSVFLLTRSLTKLRSPPPLSLKRKRFL